MTRKEIKAENANIDAIRARINDLTKQLKHANYDVAVSLVSRINALNCKIIAAQDRIDQSYRNTGIRQV